VLLVILVLVLRDWSSGQSPMFLLCLAAPLL